MTPVQIAGLPVWSPKRPVLLARCSQACPSHFPKHAVPTPLICVPHRSHTHTYNAEHYREFHGKVKTSLSVQHPCVGGCLPIIGLKFSTAKHSSWSTSYSLERKNTPKSPQNWPLIIDSHATLKNTYRYLPKWEKSNSPWRPRDLIELDRKQNFAAWRGRAQSLSRRVINTKAQSRESAHQSALFSKSPPPPNSNRS